MFWWERVGTRRCVDDVDLDDPAENDKGDSGGHVEQEKHQEEPRLLVSRDREDPPDGNANLVAGPGEGNEPDAENGQGYPGPDRGHGVQEKVGQHPSH